jgi:amino acid permease
MLSLDFLLSLPGKEMAYFLTEYTNVCSIYTIGPLDEALQAGYPIVNMFNNATQNLAASDVMTTVLLVALAASGIASLAAASRQLWAFARSRGVPFSEFFAPVRIV